MTINDCKNADIIIAGGGLAAIFTAYELLRQSRDTGKTLDILILAEKFNTPCSAGSHAVLEIEGMFNDRIEQIEELGILLRRGLDKIESTILAEKINCRFNKGYEIKSRTREELEDLVEAMRSNGAYTRREVKWNSKLQKFNLPGHDYSLSIDSIGQINMPEMITGMISAIRNMGGRIIEGATYQRQSKSHQNNYVVETNLGHFTTTAKPFIATGAHHQQSLIDLSLDTEVVYTMCSVTGPLSQEDANKISKKPMAICNTELNGDVLWGGLDEKGFLTIGRGGIVNPTDADRDHLQADILGQIEKMYPGLTEKYKTEISFGPMLIAENKMPIVGRMKDYDIAGGWAGMGIVAGFTAAHAYARWIVKGYEDELRVFESLQPDLFKADADTLPDNLLSDNSNFSHQALI